jgi:hypothetical protein
VTVSELHTALELLIRDGRGDMKVGMLDHTAYIVEICFVETCTVLGSSEISGEPFIRLS